MLQMLQLAVQVAVVSQQENMHDTAALPYIGYIPELPPVCRLPGRQ